MDEDEAKSIAGDWIRRLEASLLAKVSDNHDYTISGDHIYHHHHHREDSVSSSFSHDDLERKHVDLEKTSSDEKIHPEETGLLSGKKFSNQKEVVAKIKSPHEFGSVSLTTNTSKNAFGSPRIDLEDLRRKRLKRFGDLIDSSIKSSEGNSRILALEDKFLDDMLHYDQASSLGVEENCLRDVPWKSKPRNYESIRTIGDEDDNLRLELWGLRGAVESGQLDIDSYLGPLYSKTKTSTMCSGKEELKEESNSADFKTFDNSSGSQYCSLSHDANFNLKTVCQSSNTETAKCIGKGWENGKETLKDVLSWKFTFSPKREANGIESSYQFDRGSKEDFTKFSVTKPSSSFSYDNSAAPWPQIEGNLYNGFETSDSESSATAPNVPYRSNSKRNHEKSKPIKIKPLKSGKGKQKILNELTEFLDSERNSEKAAKEVFRVNQKSSEEPGYVKSPVNLEDSHLLLNKPSSMNDQDLLPNVEVTSRNSMAQYYSMPSDSQCRESNLPQEKGSHSNHGNLGFLSSLLFQKECSEKSGLKEKSLSCGGQIAKVCKTCQEVNSRVANWCIECGTALIKVEPVLLTSEQQSKYAMQCQETKILIDEALNSNKPLRNGSTTMSKAEKDLYKDVLHFSKEVDKNTGFSNESLRSNLSNYKRRWLKSSLAWSTFEPQELSKPPSILKANQKKKEIELNKKKGRKSFRSQSSSDLSAGEGTQKRHGNKNGHSRSGGQCRTTNTNYHSADDYDSKNGMSIKLELSNQERACKDDLSKKLGPGSAKLSSSKIQQTKLHKRRPGSAKPRTSSQSSNPDNLSPGKEQKIDERERESNVVHIPQLNLDDIGSYDRILTLIRSQHDCEPVPYLYLPDELILQIFSYLSVKDKVSCAQVCWQFHRIAMDETLWRTIVLRKNKHINDNWLESIGDRHPSSLTISQCSGNDVTSNGLRSLFRKCSSTLEEVDFSGCGGGELIGESILLHIAARCASVVSVDVSWTNVSDNGVEALAENVRRLECLCLNGCQAITDKSLTCISNKHGESLRIFEVFGCFNISPASLQVFANKCIHLQTLNIGQCHKMTDNAIGNLVSHLPDLENLDLRGCKQARDSAVKKIVRHCPHLTSLVLANCPLVTDVALSEISTNLPGIKSLDICGCANITDAGVRALARCCHKLELLDLSSTGNSVTSKSVLSLGNYCSQSLRVLKLSFCADITVHTVNQLAKNCKKLRLLHLYGCKRIKDHDKLKKINPLLVIEK